MKPKLICILSLAILTLGCRSTKITDSWNAKEPPEHFQEVVVLALVPPEKLALRERLENHMAEDLCQIGYYTLSALDAYGKDAFCGMCEKEILEKLKRDQVDAVVTIALVGRNKEKEYIGNKIPRIPAASSITLYDYQEDVARKMEEPGYYVVQTFYYWETNVYRVRDQKLLYSARTETVDPLWAENFAHDYGKLIIKDMIRSKVFEKPETPNPFLH